VTAFSAPGSVRVYLPATLATLAAGYLAGGFEAGHSAHAVTPALREWYVEGDQEELEYSAMSEAVEASVRLLAAERATDAALAERYRYRRVVVAADVSPADVLAGGGQGRPRSAVLLGAPVPLRAVVSVHVDDDDAVGAVRDAVAALPAAEQGDDDALFALDEALSHELLWYDVTEIPDLI
jgi:hypothetical protein